MEITFHREGLPPLDLSPYWQSARFATAAVGGFADCSLSLPGGIARWRRELQYLGLLRITDGPHILFEGQLEDITPSLEKTDIQAYGLRRRLEQTSVRKVWSLRAISWATMPGSTGATIFSTRTRQDNALVVNAGQYDISDLTKFGVSLIGTGAVLNTLEGEAAQGRLPAGVTVVRFLSDYKYVNEFASGVVRQAIGATTDGTTWSGITSVTFGVGTTTGTFNTTLGGDAVGIRLAVYNDSGGDIAPSGAAHYDWSNIRLVYATEDASGGFYGGTILRDLLALVPDLRIGIIEDGSDFTIEAIERSVRNTALSVVEEIANYYTREWGVWEDGRFDWKSVNRDEPHWLVGVADLADLDLKATIDNLVRTVYLGYVDATNLETKEVNATGIDRRNPFVALGKTKDAVAQPPFLLTANTAQKLADRLVADQGGYPMLSGRIVLPASAFVANALGGPRPAYTIRAGENILVNDLPKTEPLRQGRDGETLFHIASCEVNMTENRVSLEVDSYQRRSDILLARLASATRTVTG